jgi:ABC-2 type transport system permease protein
MIMFGFGFGPFVSLGSSNYTEFLAPGIIGMSLLFTSIFSGFSVIWDKQFGFMKEMLVAPISRTSIMVGKTIGGAATAIFEASLVLVVAILLNFITLPSVYTLLLMFLVMILISCGMVSLGLVIATRFENMEGFQLIMAFLVMPMFMLSGALFPITKLPPVLTAFVSLNPMTYGVDALRYVLSGTSVLAPFVSLGIIGMFTLTMIFLGAYSFRRIR